MARWPSSPPSRASTSSPSASRRSTLGSRPRASPRSRRPAYYRAEDNLGVFDAHDKNLIRAGELLVPFDVIPCHPGGGFLAFIEETLTTRRTP